MPTVVKGSGGGKKIKDATAVPSDVASGKIFYNNDGRQVGNGGNPWTDLKSLEITIGDYGSGNNVPQPNGVELNDYLTTFYSDDSNYPFRDYYMGSSLFNKRIAFSGNIKFIERLKTTKKYYVYFKEFGNKYGGGILMRNERGNTAVVIFCNGKYLYTLNLNETFNGEKFRIWYR